MILSALLAATVAIHKLPPIIDGDCDEMRVKHEVTVPRFTLHSRAAAKEINDLIEARARDEVSYDDEAQEDCPKQDPRMRIGLVEIVCTAKRISERLVGVSCRAEADTGAHPAGWPESYNFAIDGDRVKELDIDDIFIDGYEPELQRLANSQKIDAVTLGCCSIEVATDLNSHSYGTVEIPYASLRKILRPEIWALVRERQR